MENLWFGPWWLPQAALGLALVVMSGCCLPPLGKPSSCPLCGQGNNGTGPPAAKPSGAAASHQEGKGTIVPAGHQVREMPEHIVRLFERLHSVEDDRKAMRARMELIEGQLENKEENLSQAVKDIQSATEEINQTRLEVQRSKAEVLVLRKRITTLEKENKESLESIIRILEQMLDREKPSRQPKSPEGPRLP